MTATSDGVGRGSEFTVRLPAASPPPAPRPVRPPIHAPRRAVRIQRVLVIDDNRDGAEMIGELLATAGHDVRVANDPSQALSSADDFRPQVAIVDLGLPVMDGYTLGRELRSRLHEAPPQLIALTGYGQDRDRLRSRDAGFAFHLVKPSMPNSSWSLPTPSAATRAEGQITAAARFVEPRAEARTGSVRRPVRRRARRCSRRGESIRNRWRCEARPAFARLVRPWRRLRRVSASPVLAIARPAMCPV